VAAFNFSKDVLQKYGGHTQAGGFSLKADNIPAFYDKLLEYAEKVSLEITDPVLEIDAEVNSTDLTWQNLEYIEKMGPFGIHNPKPRLMAQGFEVLDVRLVGAQSQHLKLKVGFGTHKLEAICFRQGFLATSLSLGKKIDAVFELSANEWNGHKDMQLKISDIKIHD
jgi:single-stranded-DNA-specific exonuclease